MSESKQWTGANFWDLGLAWLRDWVLSPAQKRLQGELIAFRVSNFASMR